VSDDPLRSLRDDLVARARGAATAPVPPRRGRRRVRLAAVAVAALGASGAIATGAFDGAEIDRGAERDGSWPYTVRLERGKLPHEYCLTLSRPYPRASKYPLPPGGMLGRSQECGVLVPGDVVPRTSQLLAGGRHVVYGMARLDAATVEARGPGPDEIHRVRPRRVAGYEVAAFVIHVPVDEREDAPPRWTEEPVLTPAGVLCRSLGPSDAALQEIREFLRDPDARCPRVERVRLPPAPPSMRPFPEGPRAVVARDRDGRILEVVMADTRIGRDGRVRPYGTPGSAGSNTASRSDVPPARRP
jgi:hypothetical protein